MTSVTGHVLETSRLAFCYNHIFMFLHMSAQGEYSYLFRDCRVIPIPFNGISLKITYVRDTKLTVYFQIFVLFLKLEQSVTEIYLYLYIVTFYINYSV